MFNLVMGPIPATPSGSATIIGNRVFEYTDDHIKAGLTRTGSPDLEALSRLPCLFMQEGIGDEVAYVGKIIRARFSNSDIAYEYVIETDIAPLENRWIYAHRAALDMPHDFEFSRHHWAVKDIDLFRFLLRASRPRRQRPSVFHLDEHENIDRTLVSAMMPFDAAFDPVYASIKAACENARAECKRADDFWENPAIMQDVVALIDRSLIVVCDCSGRNPNVFYEAGIAHTLGREVILIAQNDHDIPFDLRHLRFVKYLNNNEGRGTLAAALEARIRTVMQR